MGTLTTGEMVMETDLAAVAMRVGGSLLALALLSVIIRRMGGGWRWMGVPWLLLLVAVAVTARGAFDPTSLVVAVVIAAPTVILIVLLLLAVLGVKTPARNGAEPS